MKKLYYFGCIGNKGHYLWESNNSSCYKLTDIPGLNLDLIKVLDGAFTPGNTREQGVYLISKVPPITIVSWWDYTIDQRTGSNSNLIAYGYSNVNEILNDAKVKFPSVMNRQLKLISSELNNL